MRSTPKFQVGDRVTREQYLDDGTWMRLGDDCLPGPLKHGVVSRIYTEPRSRLHPHADRHLLYEVTWDDGKVGPGYFEHGIAAENVT